MPHIFKHKTVASYRIADSIAPREFFQFVNGLLELDTDADRDRFLACAQTLPARELRDIVELDPEAIRTLERPISAIVRGAQDSKNIPSNVKGEGGRTLVGVGESLEEQQKKLQESPSEPSEAGKTLTPPPAAPANPLENLFKKN